MNLNLLSSLCLSAFLLVGCAHVKEKPPEPLACVVGGATLGAATAGVVSVGSAAPAGAFIGGLTGGYNCTDQDQDTVIDQYDFCPNTPLGAPVNLRGCAKDSDEDGVVDHIDACPHSAVSFEVDAQGCPVPLNRSNLAGQYKVPSQCSTYITVVGNRLTRTKPVLFGSNSTAINADGLMTLMCAADAAKGTQAKLIQLLGYTDSTGSAEYNQELSERRVANARSVLLSEGLLESQLYIAARGKAEPVTGNGSAVARSYDRRVEISALY